MPAKKAKTAAQKRTAKKAPAKRTRKKAAPKQDLKTAPEPTAAAPTIQPDATNTPRTEGRPESTAVEERKIHDPGTTLGNPSV